MDKVIIIPTPIKKTYSNQFFKHIYLSDKQLDFCYYFMFGIPNELRVMALNYPDREEIKESLTLNYLPQYKVNTSSFLGRFKPLKYKYKNGLGSYMLAYHNNNYETAKRNSKKLLKNPYILLELYFMYYWSVKGKGKDYPIFRGMELYKSPLTLQALESGKIAFNDGLKIEDFITEDLKRIVLTRNWE